MRSVTSNGGRDETELENMMVEVGTVDIVGSSVYIFKPCLGG